MIIVSVAGLQARPQPRSKMLHNTVVVVNWSLWQIAYQQVPVAHDNKIMMQKLG